MSEGEEVNQLYEGGLSETQCYSSGEGILNTNSQNIGHSQTQRQASGVFHAWQPNSHVLSSQYSNNQPYPNMPYCPQPIRPTPYTNMPYYQHNIHPSHYPPIHATQPSNNPLAQQSIHPTSSEASHRTKSSNWSKEEDLQLTIAYDRISSDPGVGVGQKKGRLWDRVLELFTTLMESKHNLKPEHNFRSTSACENRMSEIKTQCSRWTAARHGAMSQNHSGWSPEDMEKLCHSLYEAEKKGPFKCEECWKVLKENPKWNDCWNKKSGNNSCSTTGSRTTGSRATGSRHVRSSPSTNVFVNENVSNDDIPDDMEPQIPVTPRTQSVEPEQEVGNNRMGTCTPNLDGPASIHIQRPPGMQKVKASTQRQRRNKQLLQAQSSANQSFTAGLMNMQSETNSKWDKIQEADRMRDLKDDERYNELRHIQALEHEMKVASKRSKLAQERGILGQELLEAIQLLDKIDPLTLLTSSQKGMYEIKKKTVQDYEDSYEALGDMLDKLKYVSPRSVHQQANITSAGASRKRLFDEGNEANLGS